MLTYIHSMRRVLSYAFVGLVLSTSPSFAQVSFEWPDTTVDLSRYSTLEQCRAAVDRVRHMLASSEFMRTGVWSDTVVADNSATDDGTHASVRETADQCLTSATPDSIEGEHHRLLIPLLFEAGRGDDAVELTRRRIAEFEQAGDSSILASVDTVLAVYKAVHRPELALIDLIEEEYLPRLNSRVARFRLYLRLTLAMGLSPSAGRVRPDSGHGVTYGMQLLALADSLSPAERKVLAREEEIVQAFLNGEGDALSEQLSLIFQHLGRDYEALDSLQVSTSAYIAHKRRIYSRLFDQPTEAVNSITGIPYGEDAPSVQADLWRGCDSRCESRPTPGRVSLVMFKDELDGACVISCIHWVVTLRRLEERFPELETTIVKATRGHFGTLKTGVTPDKEADFSREWLDALGIRATLAVFEMPHWYLPDPDGRRIDSGTENERNYSFGNIVSVDEELKNIHKPTVILIDREGKVVEILSLLGDVNSLTRIIQALFDQEQQTT